MLDHGKVMEFGTPWDLIQKEDGMFRDLCRQSGEETQLFEVSDKTSLTYTHRAVDGEGCT